MGNTNRTPRKIIPANNTPPGSLTINPNHLRMGTKIGEGAMSVVYRAKLKGRDVALKKYKEDPNHFNVELYRNEKKILAELRHPNIIPLLGVMETQRDLGLVLMLAVNSTLADELFFHRGKNRNPDLYREIALGTAEGIKYLHAQRIIYTDIKSNNILLDKNKKPMICDFNLSAFIPENKTHLFSRWPRGTFLWSAPEVNNQIGFYYQFNLKFDSYAFGWLLYVMATNDRIEPPVTNANPGSKTTTSASQDTNLPYMPIQMPAVTKTLIHQCFSLNPALRPSFKEITDILKSEKVIFCY